MASAEMKPGERKVISDGTEGPVVEIIKRTKPSTDSDGPLSETEETEDTTEADNAGDL